MEHTTVIELRIQKGESPPSVHLTLVASFESTRRGWLVTASEGARVYRAIGDTQTDAILNLLKQGIG